MATVNKIDINSSGEPGNFLNYVYPVGSIYISVNNVNPSALFGGTWEQFSNGRVLIGVGTTSDAEGYSNTISANESSGYWKIRNVSHTHTFNHTHSDTFSIASAGSHSHTMNHKHGDTFSVASGGAHTHSIGCDMDTAAGGYGWSVHNNKSGAEKVIGYTSSSGSHTHTLNGAVSTYSGSTSTASSHTHTINGSVSTYNGSTSSTGVAATSTTSGISIRNDYNLPPYTSVYIWKRTA